MSFQFSQGLPNLACNNLRLKADINFFFFSCDQAALWMAQSVCLSVRLSICPLLPMAEVMSVQKVKVRVKWIMI